MVAIANPKDIERKAYLSYHQDGLVDTFIGATITAFAAFLAYDPAMVAVGAGVMCSFVFIYAGAKKVITVPRLGYVEFASDRRGKIRKVILMGVTALVLANVITLAAWMRPSLGVSLEEHFTLIAGGVGALLLAVTAWVSGLPRFYAYAVLVLCVLWLGYRRMELWESLMVIGIVVVSCGLLLLGRFVRGHPRGGR
jgi:hypothetical protein